MDELKKRIERLLKKEGVTMSEQDIKQYAAELYQLFIESKALILPEGNEEMQDDLINGVIATLTIENEKLKRELEKAKEASQALSVRTERPKEFLTPKDKVSDLAFKGELYNKTLQPVALEGKNSPIEITSFVNIAFDEMPGVQITGRRELTPYDREVHDAIVTLYALGNNEYITTNMIYQMLTGNTNSRKNVKVNPRAAEAISNSITKLMYSKLTIRVSDEEAKAWNFDKFTYDSTVIQAERITASVNGNVTECIHLLKEPKLYEYASLKKQIGRFDLQLLNTPINKTEEIITLQGYLYRRILGMKGNRALTRTILYEKIYKQLEIEAASEGALRKKKTKLRGHIKTILDDWKQQGFIKGYSENKKATTMYSIVIEI